jgi:hypothetical protein
MFGRVSMAKIVTMFQLHPAADSLNVLKVAMDRACYHYRIERSIRYGDALSMVVDGADMSRYSLPYFCVTDKQSAEG